MSISFPVLFAGKAFAGEDDDSRRDTLRAMVIPALLPNPFMGMVMAAILAKRGAQEPKAVVAPAAVLANVPPPQANQPLPQANQPRPQANPPPQASPPSASAAIAQFIPPDFFPSFLGLSWRHALTFANLVGVTPHSHDEANNLVVIRQHPHPGEDRPNNAREVHLHFGPRNVIGL